MFPSISYDSALRTMLLMGLGLWLAPFANAQDRGMVRTSSSSVLDGPTTYVLAVGVADFKHLSTDFDLRYAEADASAFTEGLASALGDSIPQEQITLLVGRAATLESVSIALRETLAAADENDTVILFFSTHGVLSGDEGYLLTWDTTPNERLPYTSLPTKDIVSAVNRSRAGHVLLFTDACHAGITGAGTKGASVPSFDPSTIQVDHRSFFNQASSTIMQPSLEGPEYCGGHGAYTCALLMAMQGAVDRDSDGIVSLRELQIYVPPIVDSLTKGQQSPETKGRFDSQHVFVRVLPKPSDEKGDVEFGFSFADVAPEEIGVMEAYEDEAATALIPVVESYDVPGGSESSSAENVVSDEAALKGKEAPAGSLAPVLVGGELEMSVVETSDNEDKSDETIFVYYSQMLLAEHDKTDLSSTSPLELDGASGSLHISELGAGEPVSLMDGDVFTNVVRVEEMRRRNKSALLALPSLGVAGGATYLVHEKYGISEPVLITLGVVGAAALLTTAQYTAITGLRTCRMMGEDLSTPKGTYPRLRCQLGVSAVAFGSAGIALSGVAGGFFIGAGVSSGLGSVFLFIGGIAFTGVAGWAVAPSILLSTGQHLNNARLIPGVSTPGTSYVPPDPTQPMWAHAGWIPMGVTVVGTF